MGFPVDYSDVCLPRLLLRIFLLLAHLRRFLLWAFRSVGLGDLLDPDDPAQDLRRPSQLQHRRPAFRPVSPLLTVDEALPVLRMEELLAVEGEDSPVLHSGGCAVCLCEIGGADEVRRQRNCRHVFHRGCLDRWMAVHQRRTCPLCRAPLLDVGAEDFPAGAGDGEIGEYEAWLFGDVVEESSPMPSPVFFRPQQLLGREV